MSGIYIPSMEMPKSCFDCPIAHPALGNLGAAILGCPLIGKTLSAPFCEEKKMDNCPLVPVPEHGRLIDADALAHDLDFDVENDQRALDEMNLVGKEREHLQFDKDCKQNCMWYLSESPTIIPAEEGEG